MSYKLSKSAKEVPDSAVLKGNLDHVRTVAEQEEPESEPKADFIRGTAAIIRHMSTARLKLEAAEAWRRDDGLRDRTEPISEKEQDEWDGLLPLGMTISPPRPTTTTSYPHPSNPHDGLINPFSRHEQPAEGSLPAYTGTVHATQLLSRKRPYLPLRPLTELSRPPSYIPIPVEDSESDGSLVNWYGLRRSVAFESVGTEKPNQEWSSPIVATTITQAFEPIIENSWIVTEQIQNPYLVVVFERKWFSNRIRFWCRGSEKQAFG